MDGDEARGLLKAERRRTSARLAALRHDFSGVVEASRDTNADDEHDPEGATIAFERSQVDALVQQASGRLEDIDQALARLDGGSHGRCEVCGRAIADERLRVRPTARTCVGCT